MNFPRDYSKYDYSELTRLTDDEIARRTPRPPRVKKQLDAGWLARKERLGPTPEDTVRVHFACINSLY